MILLIMVHGHGCQSFEEEVYLNLNNMLLTVQIFSWYSCQIFENEARQQALSERIYGILYCDGHGKK